MKKIFFILFVIFTVSSCAYEDSDFRQISKEEAMESWAWKIFIFTDEGEFTPAEPVKNNFENTTKVSPIFVEDVLEMYSNDDLFLNYPDESFKEPIVFTNFALTKRKK